MKKTFKNIAVLGMAFSMVFSGLSPVAVNAGKPKNSAMVILKGYATPLKEKDKKTDRAIKKKKGIADAETTVVLHPFKENVKKQKNRKKSISRKAKNTKKNKRK